MSAKLQPFATLSPADSLVNRDLEKVAQQVAKKQYDSKVVPSTLLPKELGNMYCASLYAGLATLLHTKTEALHGKRVLMFSYGSGLASSLFSFQVHPGQPPFCVSEIVQKMSISEKLNTRIIVDPKAFVTTMHLMETRYGAKDFVPVSSHSTLRPGTFYLTEVDALYRRRYSRKISTTKPEIISSNGTNGVQFN